MYATEKIYLAVCVGVLVGIILSFIYSNITINIPDVVWAGIIASGLTLSGVFFTNRSYYKRHKEQLNHEMKLKKIEREMSLRKEIYLNLAKSVSAQNSVLGELFNLDVSFSEIGKTLAENARNFAKAEIIGSNNTIEAISKYTQLFHKYYFDLILIRTSLLELKDKISIQHSLYNQSTEETTKLLETMKHINITNNVNNLNLIHISAQFDEEIDRQKEIEKTIDEFRNELNKKHIKFIRKCVTALKDCGTRVPEIIFTVRNELDFNLDFDEGKYLKFYSTREKEGMEIMKQFENQLEEKLNQQTQN